MLNDKQRREHRKRSKALWRKRHRDEQRYSFYRSKAHVFMTKLGRKQDVERLIHSARERFRGD